jgi:hypothetical protein
VKRPFGRCRCGWEDNSKVDLREIGWEDVDWIYLSHDRLVAGYYEHGNETTGSINVREFLDWLGDFSFSRRSLLCGTIYSQLLQKVVFHKSDILYEVDESCCMIVYLETNSFIWDLF